MNNAAMLKMTYVNCHGRFRFMSLFKHSEVIDNFKPVFLCVKTGSNLGIHLGSARVRNTLKMAHLKTLTYEN